MVTPSKFGQLGEINLIGLNTYQTSSTSSTKNEMLSAGINLATGIGGLLIAGLVSRKAADGGDKTGATPLQTAEQTAQAALQNIDIQLAEVNGQISYLESECTSQAQIDAKEQSIKDLEAEVNNKITTSDGTPVNKETVDKYIQASKKYETAKTNLGTANTNVANATTQRDALQQELNSIDESCGTEEEVKTAKETKQKELDAANRKLATAKEEEAKAQQQFEEAKKAMIGLNVTVKEDMTTEKLDWQKSVDAKLDKIESEKAELAEMKATMNTNKKSLETLYAKRAQLEQERAGAQAVYDKMVTDSVVANGKRNQQISDAGADYTAADKKDGNWLSRTWQKTKGIFSKSARAEYKLMKSAHEDKNNAEDRLQALGSSGRDYTETKANQKAQNFCNKPENKKYKNMAQLAAKFIEKNLDATDEEIKAHLEGIIEKANS